MGSRGFSLVEILVVLVILGLTVTFTTLGFQRLEDDRLQKQAGHLSDWLQQLSDSAVLDGAVYGARFDAETRRFRSEFYFDNRWWEITGDGAESEALAGDFRLEIDTDKGSRAMTDRQGGNGKAAAPGIIFMPTGLTFPERLRLETADRRAAVIERDGDGLYTWRIGE